MYLLNMNITSDIACLACGYSSVGEIGPLPYRNGLFQLSTPGSLFKCKKCGLFFRNPYPSEAEIEQGYQCLPDDIWSDGDWRPDFELAIQALFKSFSSGNVLDVGCFCGELLTMLPDSFRKFGVEPSEMACEEAISHGIEIVGSSILKTKTDLPEFNCIFMLDVIEHMPNPMQVMEKAASMLKTKGILIISTGNTDAFCWRIARLDYYYYYFEHVTFYNIKWFYWAANMISMNIISSRRFSKKCSTMVEKIWDIALMYTFRITKNAFKIPGLSRYVACMYPFNKIAKLSVCPFGRRLSDHIMIVLRKE